MIESLDPFVWALALWSIRWAVLILVLVGWFRVAPPRRAATRHLLCAAALGLGLMLPLAPGWSIPTVRWARATPVPIPVARVEPVTLASDLEISAAIEPRRIEPLRSAPVLAPAPRPVSPTPMAWRPILVLAVSLVWLLGLVVALARLAAGWWVLARLRKTACPLVGSAGALFADAHRAAAPGRRAVRIARHPAIASPVALGGWQPTILVPDDWDTWTPTDQRACLLHELAHLARWDDVGKLIAELARAPFWFHPGVAWLAARLDREAELAADEVAIARGVAPRDLAQLLLACARNPHRIRPRLHALAFFTSQTVTTRINRLLEADMPLAATRPSRLNPGFLVAALAALALAVGGVNTRAVDAGPPPALPQNPALATPNTTGFAVLVRDESGQPVAGATVVVGSINTPAERQVARTDPAGAARFDRAPTIDSYLVAALPGGSFTTLRVREAVGKEVTLRLPAPRALTGRVVDEAGQPVAGATVRVDQARGTPPAAYFFDLLRPLVAGTPVAEATQARTDASGTFRFAELPDGSDVRLIVAAVGKATTRSALVALRSREPGPIVAPTPVTLPPEARVAGRVVKQGPEGKVAGQVVVCREVRDRAIGFLNTETTTDADGRFEIGGLGSGQANLMLDKLPADGPYTALPAEGVRLVAEATTPVEIPLVAGVAVTGLITDGANNPQSGVEVTAYRSLALNMSGVALKTTTDAAGRYRFRLSPGGVIINATAEPGHSESYVRQVITVPADKFLFEVNSIIYDTGVILTGQIVDATGKPLGGAKLAAAPQTTRMPPVETASTVADAEGRFVLRNKVADGQAVPLGQSVLFQVFLTDGRSFSTTAVPSRSPAATTIKLPTFAAGGPVGPDQVAADEVAGLVVDAQGRPIEGVLADVNTRVPGREARTDAAGLFRVKGLTPSPSSEIEISKDGYAPVEVYDVPLGRKGWVVVLDDRTAFEGRVLAPDGKPVADAPILADSGSFRVGMYERLSRFVGKSGADGRYRLPLAAGMWSLSVRVPGVGVLRLPKQVLATDEVRPLDLQLIPPVTFVAKVVDAADGSPRAGFLLQDFANRDAKGTSDAGGMIRIPDMVPGPFESRSITLIAPEFGRWWAKAAIDPRMRQPAMVGFLTNGNFLGFDVQPGMAPVVIQTERAATIGGRVLDPDGQPRAGVSVTLDATRSGDLTPGVSRSRSTTDAAGAFVVQLPASLKDAYRLLAHDGPPRTKGTWADATSPFLSTQPGQVVDDVTIRLNRPGTIEGRVDDVQGQPVANQEVRLSKPRGPNSRSNDGTVRTGADGNFRFTGLTPGEHSVQIEPFGMSPTAVGNDTAQTVDLKEGETRSEVVLTKRLEFLAPPERSVPLR